MTMLTMLVMLTMMIITTPEGSQGAETKAHFFHPWVGAVLCCGQVGVVSVSTCNMLWFGPTTVVQCHCHLPHRLLPFKLFKLVL